MTVLDGILNYLETYPGLRGGQLALDYLPEEARSYSLEPEPCDPVLSEYMDGGQRRQCLLTLASRCFFGPDPGEQGENHRWLSDLERWLRDKGRAGELPELGEERVCLSLTVTSGGYALEAGDNGLCRYQVSLKCVYFEQPTNFT